MLGAGIATQFGTPPNYTTMIRNASAALLILWY